MHHRKTITIPKSKETIISEALTREESVRLHRLAAAEIVGVEPLEEPKLPVYYKDQVNYWQVIRSAISREVTNLIKI